MNYSSSPGYSYRPRPLNVRLKLVVLALTLLLWIFSELRGATLPTPDFYAVVVDRSASMGPGVGNNNLVGPATDKLREFVAGLEPNTALQIVFFGSRVGKIGRWSDLTPDTKEEIGRWISSEFRPSGGTRLYDSVGQVLTGLLAEQGQFGRIGLLVFTDGEDNESRQFTSWSELERLSGDLVAQHPTAFMRFYSLGREPRTKPGSPWIVQEAPDAADLRKIVLEPPPQARLKIVPENVEAGQTLTFVVLPSPGRIEAIRWEFGDGTESRESAAEHAYAADGVYAGTLTVTGPSGTDTKPFSVAVTRRVPLVAAFSWAPRIVRVGDSIEFFDASSGGPTSWRWSINGQPVGEGARSSCSAAEAGNLIVRLDTGRCNETHHVEHVVAVLPPRLDAAFAIAPGHSFVLGTEILLRTTTINDGAKHEWCAAGVQFGEGPELRWTPPSAGLVEIVHRVLRGDDVAEAVDRVQIISQPPPAKFIVTPGLEVDLGQDLTLSARVTDPAWQHTFSLSTGETYHGATVTFPAKRLGRVEITHVVENASGKAEARETLVVRDAVTAEFTVQVASLRSPAEVRFTPRSRGSIISREWVFGDGHSSTEETPLHSYASPGEYRPVLKARDVAGREHSWQISAPIAVALPRPWWLPWSISAGAVIALTAVIATVIWDRRRLVDLDGRLEWQFGGNRGRAELAGRQFDLGSLNIPGWKPVSAYTLVRRKAAGLQLLHEGSLEQAVEEDSSLEAEGVRLRLLP